MMVLSVTLSDEQLDALAAAVAERLNANAAPAGGLVDAATVAAAPGVSRDWVYEHAAEIGGVRAGSGDRPRWRFDLERARSTWQPASEPERTRARRRQSPNGNGQRLLPVRGEVER